MTQKQIESSTVFHTPHGDLEVPAPPITIDVQATYKSNLAPLWLVFKDHIFNTHNITSIKREENSIIIRTVENISYRIHVTDLNVTWDALQKAFTEGITG